jgi:hypothetical protein
MSENPDEGTIPPDPDADPENLSPRDDRGPGDDSYADPDADPENLNPRQG